MINKLFLGRIRKFSVNEFSCKVVETAVKYGTNHQMQCWIEEICFLDANEVDAPVLSLAKHEFGHKVVIVMLHVLRNKQVHRELKSSILFKQEDLLLNQYGQKILKLIKLEQ